MSPYKVTADFEQALCAYTGAPYAVAVNSGTAALLLSLLWHARCWSTREIELPKRTYVSVPCAVKQAGFKIKWVDHHWRGAYMLLPTLIVDSARRFTSGMYVPGQFQCVSFSASKILGAEQGGAILHDNPAADIWFRRMRFDGRTEGVPAMEDEFTMIGHHCLMIPSVAATLLVQLYHLPKHNEDLPEVEYPDLSRFPVFG